MINHFKLALVCCIILGTIAFGPNEVFGEGKNHAMDNLEADRLTYDEATKVMKASGNVKYSDENALIIAPLLQYDEVQKVLVGENMVNISLKNFDNQGKAATIQAEKIIYEKDKQKLTTKGKVVLTIPNFDTEGHLALLQAEEIVYDRRKKTIIAKNNICMSFDSNYIYGDALEYHMMDKQLQVSSHVKVLSKEKDTFICESLLYDVKKKEGRLDNYHYQFWSDGIAYFSKGKLLIFDDEKVIMRFADLTTCELSPPHYHFYSNKVEYYPNKKLVLTDNSYWRGDKKIINLNKTVIAIHNNQPVLPVIGYSEDEGWYFKTTDYYDLSAKDYGVVYKDWMSLRGIGLGFREYHFGRQDRINEIFLYGSKKPGIASQVLKGEWITRQTGQEKMLSFKKEDNQWKGEGIQTQANWSSLSNSQSSKTAVNIDYFSRMGYQDYKYTGGQINQSIRNSKELITYWDYNYSKNKYSDGQSFSDQNFSAKMEYTKPSYITDLSIVGSKNNLNYRPKVTLQSTFDSPFQFFLSSAQVSRSHPDVDVQQNDVTAYYKSKLNKLGDNTFLITNATANRTLFSDKNAITNWQVNTSVLNNLGSKAYISANFILGQNRGFDPVINSVTNSDSRLLKMEANYIFDENYRSDLVFGYDFSKHINQDVTLSLEGRTYPFWNWMLSSQYDAEKKKWRSLGMMLTLNPESSITGSIQFNYDMQQKMLQDASIRLEGQLGSKWTYSIKTDYYTDGQVNLSEIKFIKDMECQDIVVSIYPYEKMFYIELQFKNASSKQANG